MSEPSPLADYLRLISPAIEKNIREWISRRSKYPCWKELVYQPFYELFNRGGKRLRAILCCLSYHSLGGESNPRIYRFSAIPEIMHHSSLILDDVQDNSSFRRGGPALHKIYGEAMAINTAGFLQFYPQLIIKRSHLAPALKAELMGLILEGISDCYIGQGMDILGSSDNLYSAGMDKYLQVVSLKTGSLFKVSLLIGALLAGASKRQIENLGKIAYTLGIAFQIQNDLRGKIADDIREGKLTYPIVHTFSKARPEQRERLKKILVSHNSAKPRIKQALSLMEEYNAMACGYEYIKQLLRGLEKNLSSLIMKPPYLLLFQELFKNIFPGTRIIPEAR